MRALDDVSLRIESNTFVSLLGPTGAGKTTMLKILAGLARPTAGKVHIDGADVTQLPANKRRVGVVFEEYALAPKRSGFENVASGLRGRHLSEEEVRARVHHVAERLAVEDLLVKTSGEMDGVQLLRVALARALVAEPAVLLLDEPLSPFGVTVRFRLRAALRRLQRNFEQTILCTTHDYAEAMAMADHIAVMDEGRLQQQDTPQNIYHHPANRFVAGFTGTPPMNFVSCRLVQSDGHHYLDEGHWRLDVSRVAEALSTRGPGSELILGVRPEDIHIFDADLGGDALPAEITGVEPLGPGTVVDLEVGCTPVRATVSYPLTVEPGEQRWIKFGKIHLMDANTERTLL